MQDNNNQNNSSNNNDSDNLNLNIGESLINISENIYKSFEDIMGLSKKIVIQMNYKDCIHKIRQKYNLNGINDRQLLEALIKTEGNVEKAIILLLKKS